jgi:hypothetical protein
VDGSCPPRQRKQVGDAPIASCRGDVRGRPCVPGRRVRRARLDVAGRRADPADVLREFRPVRGRPAPRRRHRSGDRPHRARACERHRLVRRLRSRRGPRGHDHDRRRLRGDVAPARRNQRRPRRRGRGGSGGRHRRREQRCGHPAAARPPRRSRRGRPEWIRRPARAAACTTDRTASGARAAGACAGSSRHRRDPGAAARAGGDRGRRAGRGDVAARSCRRAVSCHAARHGEASCGQAGRDSDHRAVAAWAPDRRCGGEAASPVACRPQHAGAERAGAERAGAERAGDVCGLESGRNAARELGTAGCRRDVGRQSAGECETATGPSAAGQRSSGRRASGRSGYPPGRATGRPWPGPRHARAYGPRAGPPAGHPAGGRIRSPGEAETCAYHLWG